MMTPIRYFAFCLLAAGFLATCQSQKSSDLLPQERLLLDSLKFDLSLFEAVKKLNGDTLSRLQSYYWVDTAELTFDQGIQIKTDSEKSFELVERFYEPFKSNGYFIFLADENFGYEPDIVAVIRSNDQFEILKIRGTGAWNYDHDTRWVIELAKNIHSRYPFEIVAADHESFEARFLQPPTDWLAFAKELYEVCPDIVTQGAGSLEGLADEMKNANGFYLWWD